LLVCTGKNKAKTAVSVAVEAKPEVEIWRRPKKIERVLTISYRPSIVTLTLNAFQKYCRRDIIEGKRRGEERRKG